MLCSTEAATFFQEQFWGITVAPTCGQALCRLGCWPATRVRELPKHTSNFHNNKEKQKRGPTCELPVVCRDHLCAGATATAVAVAVEVWVLLAKGQAHHLAAAQGLGRAAQGVTHRPAGSGDSVVWCSAH